MKNNTEKDKTWTEASMAECSAMCLNFFKWVNSIAACYYLKKETRPLLDSLDRQKKTLAEAQEKLDK